MERGGYKNPSVLASRHTGHPMSSCYRHRVIAANSGIFLYGRWKEVIAASNVNAPKINLWGCWDLAASNVNAPKINLRGCWDLASHSVNKRSKEGK